MKLTFKTETGSTYELDKIAMTWKRADKSVDSGKIRQEGGSLTEWPEVRIGYPVHLFDTAILPGHVAHAVRTSLVVHISFENDDKGWADSYYWGTPAVDPLQGVQE